MEIIHLQIVENSRQLQNLIIICGGFSVILLLKCILHYFLYLKLSAISKANAEQSKAWFSLSKDYHSLSHSILQQACVKVEDSAIKCENVIHESKEVTETLTKINE